MAGELILIVEDNDKNRKLVRDVLTFKRYAVIEAETGEAGIRLAQARLPSLGVLLTALLIPSLLARIRAEERLLRTQFGGEYDTYRARTARLIPGLY